MSLSSKLDSLAIDVHELMQYFRSHNQPANLAIYVNNSDSLVTHHLEECVQSAKKMISSAATIVEARSVRGGSEFGDPMSEERIRRVQQWIPEPPIFENNDNSEDQPANTVNPVHYHNISSLSDTSTINSSRFIQDLFESSSSKHVDISLQNVNQQSSDLPPNDTDSDLAYEKIHHWIRFAYQKFQAKDFAAAESFLKKILEESERKYPNGCRWKDETTKMLAISYCHQRKWEEADKIFATDFNGRNKTLEELAMQYFLQGKKDEAGKICLGKKFPAREKILELLATSYYHEKKWLEASLFLSQLLQYDMEEKIRLERMHILAEIAFTQKHFEEAKTWCLKAVQGRLTLLGKRNFQFYQSVNLLAQIYDAMGDFVEAEGYKAVLAVLPPGLQGNFISSKTTNFRMC
jgi:tetratricopeptide (TPR) repeat protein